MARKTKTAAKARGSRRTARKGSAGGSFSLFQTIYEYRAWFALLLAIIIAAAGFVLRMQPALKHGYELHANDPWIMYWMNKQLAEHGPLYWYDLGRDNPATSIFWYPWGRDFTHTEYPLSSMVFAITYPLASALGLGVKEYSVVEPALAGFFIVLTGFLLVRRIAGNLPGVLAAFMLAFVPGVVERTIAGFIEKQGLAMPLVLLHMYFLAGLVKNPSRKEAVLAGLTLGLVAWTWGGWEGIMAFTAATLVLLPLVKEVDMGLIRCSALMIALALIISMASPTETFRSILLGPGLVLPASLIPLGVGYLLGTGRILPRLVERRGVAPVYLGMVVVLGIVFLALTFTGALGFSERILAFLGKTVEDPLVASVSEHQVLPARFTFNKTGVPLLLTIATLGLTLVWARRKPELLVLAVPGLASLYLAFRSAYMMQTTATILSVAGAASILPLARYLSRTAGVADGRGGFDSMGFSLSVVGIIVVFGLASAHLGASMSLAGATIPTIKAGGIGLTVENNAWVYTLDFLANQTPPGSVVVAWWDYGYWISVGGGRASVADGATMNSTQIRLLARALTAPDEQEALDIIFNKFRAPANETYLLVFDVFRSVRLNNETWMTGPFISIPSGTVGLADIPKSIWMLRIGGRLNLTEFQPYFVPRIINAGPNQQFAVTTPNWLDDRVANTLIYRMFINGVYSMNDTLAGGCRDFRGNHVFVDWTTLTLTNLTVVSAQPLEYIKPYKTIVDCLVDTDQEKLYVAVFIFKATPPE